MEHPCGSLSARRAWIEIKTRSQPSRPRAVALRKESVDRNLYYGDDLTFSDGVALRKESVDRNVQKRGAGFLDWASLSARRAWIEIISSRGNFAYVDCRSPQGERG